MTQLSLDQLEHIAAEQIELLRQEQGAHTLWPIWPHLTIEGAKVLLLMGYNLALQEQLAEVREERRQFVERYQ